jgi:tRNA(Arg) A34 adenosine deaminase TadA
MDAEFASPLPNWVTDIVRPSDRFQDDVSLVDRCIDLAVASARNGGGPFGAIVAKEDGEIVSVGWNRVVDAIDSTAHAEIEALRNAQLRLGTHDLQATDEGPLTLFSSCEPCIQCYGAIYWSGLDRVVAAAHADNAEALGFDEGPVSDELWKRAHDAKGITYEPDADATRDVEAPFETYEERGGPLY